MTIKIRARLTNIFMQFTKELEIGLNAVVDACRLCVQVRNTLITSDTLDKKDHSPVTVADFGAQALILHALSVALPNDACVAEEDGDNLRTPENAGLFNQVRKAVNAVKPGMTETEVLACIDRGQGNGGHGRFWTLDPIDGTKGFLRNEQYAVALALIVGGEVVLGILGCPNLPVDSHKPEGEKGCLFYAVKGGGAFMRTLNGADHQGRKIHVKNEVDIVRARFCESVEKAHTSHDASAEIAKRLGVLVEPYRIDSQCKYSALARGDAEVYLRLPTKPGYVERIWDHAAGCCIVTEAGGVVSDVNGKTLDFTLGRGLESNRGVVVTLPAFAEKVLTAVQAVLAK